MTPASEQSIAELLRASRRDEDVLAFPIDAANFGLLTQQTIEKLLKALITAHEVRYKYTHNLTILAQDLGRLEESVPAFLSEVSWLNDFAGTWRYQDVSEISAEERDRLRAELVQLRLWVMGRITVLHPLIVLDSAAAGG